MCSVWEKQEATSCRYSQTVPRDSRVVDRAW